jgi:hypothetical protein
MRRKLWLAPLLALTLAALACNSGLPADTVLFQDDFSDAGGGWKYTTYSTFADGHMEVLNDEKGTIVRTVIDEPGLADVHLEVSARNTGSASDVVFGLVCDFSISNDQASYYFLGIGTDGYYVVGKYVKGALTTLTEDTGGRFADETATYRLGADCSNGAQTLYVDGKKVASTTDASLSNGDVGLFVGAYKQAGAATTFDDFAATQLK